MQFGKQILAQQVPGWSQYYLDYKGLKKIVSSLASGRPGAEAAALALGTRPTEPGGQPGAPNVPTRQLILLPDVLDISSNRASVEDEIQDTQTLELLSASGRDEDRGPYFQEHKTAFFFKLERELEKVRGSRSYLYIAIILRH